MSDPTYWLLKDGGAQLVQGPLRLKLRLDDPSRGASDLSLNATPLDLQLWSWSPVDANAPSLLDCYVRGRDLIAEYGPREDFPFHTQAYWRCEPELPSTAAGLSLILSVRTHQLDTHPRFNVSTHSPDGELTLLDADPATPESPCVLFTGQRDAWSAVETVQQGDWIAGQQVQSDGGGSRWRLFDHFLEKGVIRRAKVSIALAAGAIDANAARGLGRALRADGAPLTA